MAGGRFGNPGPVDRPLHRFLNDRFMQMVRDIDSLGRPRDVSERLAAIDAVTADGIREYGEAWLAAGKSSLISVGPRDWPANGDSGIATS